MLQLFVQEYGIIAALAASGLVTTLAWRAVLKKRRAQRRAAEAADKIRSTLAQAADQGQSLDFTLPQWDDEEIHLGQARYLGAHPEGMHLELWIRPGSPVLNHESVHAYFRLKHAGPMSHYDFHSSMHEYCRDGNRVEVIVPWPLELGHGERRFFAPKVENTSPEPDVRLWRTSDGPDALSPQCWEPLPDQAVLVTDIDGECLRIGLEHSQSLHLNEGSLMLCRLHLPYAEAAPLELMLAGHVQGLKRQPELSHDVVPIVWKHWAMPSENKDMQWHKLEPGLPVPLLHNWVGLKRQMA